MERVRESSFHLVRLRTAVERYFTATVGHPMARGAGGGIPGNGLRLGQGSTSPSTFTHVLGVSVLRPVPSAVPPTAVGT